MTGENKMKKVLAVILLICFVLYLTACSKDKIVSDATSDNSQITSTETQANTSNNSNVSNDSSNPNGSDVSSNNTSSGTNNSNGTNSSSNSNDTNSSNSSNNSNGTNGTNNSSTPAHTHNFSNATCTAPAKCSCGATKESALGHKWQEATCQAPKTCSVCKQTEGNKAEHIVEGTTCKWCKQVVAVNPNKLDANIEYTHLGPRFYREFDWNSETPKEYDCYILILLRLKDLTGGEEVFLETNTPLYGDDFYHNGKYYLQLAQWGEPFDTLYKITDSEIIVTLTPGGYEEKQVFNLELLSDNTLRVKSISGSELIPLSQHSGLKVGSIFYPNPHCRFD